MTWMARWSRLLLRFYPRDYRRTHGDELTAFFLERHAQVRAGGGRFAVARFFARALADAAIQGCAERWPRRFGGSDDLISVERMRPMAGWNNDVRYALRTLRAQPGFTAMALLTLALGIGATTVMFSVVDALFLSPPPGVRDAGELLRLYIARQEGRVISGPDGSGGSYPDYVALRDNAHGLAGVTAFTGPRPVNLDLGPDARRITGQVVTEDFFDLLGVRPGEGRFFGSADALATQSPAVVIAHRFSRRHFGGTGEPVGGTLVVNGVTATVVGVAPEGFAGVDSEPVDVWVPAAQAEVLGFESRGWQAQALVVGRMNYVGRLEPGALAEAVEAAAAAALRHAAEGVAGLDPNPRVIAGPFITARGPKRSQPASVAIWVAFATGLLLLIACANVANLLLARAATRKREIAVRLSLGVGRGRLIRQLLTESLVLGALGCAAGLVLAFLGAELVRQFPLPPSAGRLNGRMLAFAGGITAVTSVLFGLAPALHAVRVDAVAGLKDAARTHSHDWGRLRGALLATQTALALVALCGAGLFLRSLEQALSIEPGIELERVAIVSVDLAQAGYGPAQQEVFLAQARDRLLAIPGVEGVAGSRITPLREGYLSSVDPPDRDAPALAENAFMNWVTPGFAATMGMRLLDGRPLTDSDRVDGPPVALVSADLARLLAPGGAAAGLCLAIGRSQRDGGGCTLIVGVVDSVRHRLLGDPTPYLFLPWAQHPSATRWGPPQLFVRMSGDPGGRADDLRAAVQGLAPDLPFVSVEPMTSLVRDDLLPLRIGATLSTLFGVLALALAAVGMHGLLGYFVAARTHEIGIRRSLGAQDRDVIRLVVRQAVIPVAIGAALGLAAALAGARLLEALLFGVPARDPLTFGAVVAFLGAVALLASYLPARHAARVSPRIALGE